MKDVKSSVFKEFQYDSLDDNKLVELSKSGDSSAINQLFINYSDLIRMKTHNFFITGADNDDILQEARIGLYKAIKSYDQEKHSSFKTFANLCIERQIISAIKSSNRQKHIPLNSSFSLNVSAFDNNEDTEVIEILDVNTAEDPLDTITKQEYYRFIESKIDDNLSKFEKQVLNMMIEGESYKSIADSLNSNAKSIDNAIQRIRKKASKCLDSEEMN